MNSVTGFGETRLEARRAVESLRMGVPNAAAVKAIGWSQPAHIKRFDQMLDELVGTPIAKSFGVVAGEFGTGKSHLLEFLGQRALERNFVVSHVVISNETDLAKRDQVFRSALMNASAPELFGSLLENLIARVDFESPAGQELGRWADGAPGMMAASILLALGSYGLNEPEFRQEVIEWWSGERPMNVTRVRRALTAAGIRDRYQVAAIDASTLATIRFQLVSHLIRAAGYSGWVIEFDELELIGRRTRLQRAKCYGEIASWFGEVENMGVGIGTIGAITDLFRPAVLEGRYDLDDLEDFVRARGGDANEELADRVARGMEILMQIPKEMVIRRPGLSDRRKAYLKIRELQNEAYGLKLPEPREDLIDGLPAVTPMRIYVKRWALFADLVRIGLLRPDQSLIDSLKSYTQNFDEDPDADDDDD